MQMLVAVPFAMIALAWLANLGPGPAHHRARPSRPRSTKAPRATAPRADSGVPR